jgi:hypothetical protein
VIDAEVLRVVMPWRRGDGRTGTMTLELRPGDQDDPRLKAMFDWWEERAFEKAAAAGVADLGPLGLL